MTTHNILETIATDSSSENSDERLTMREVTIFKYVWPLFQEEKKKLDLCSIFQTTAGELKDNVNEQDPVNDTVAIRGNNYYVSYIRCSSRMLDELPDDRKLLVSLRGNRASKMWIAVVLYNPKFTEEVFSTYQKLDYYKQVK